MREAVVSTDGTNGATEAGRRPKTATLDATAMSDAIKYVADAGGMCAERIHLISQTNTKFWF